MRVSRSRAPSATTKSALTVPSWISSASGVLSRNASGPATADRSIGRRLDPRRDRPVVRPQRQLHPQRNPPSHALHDPHQPRRTLGAPRHEVDHPNRSVVRLEFGLEHERPRPVAPGRRAHRARRRETPATVPLVADQRGETRRGVVARQAKPVDRAVATHEGAGLGVADEAVVLDPHDNLLSIARASSNESPRSDTRCSSPWSAPSTIGRSVRSATAPTMAPDLGAGER